MPCSRHRSSYILPRLAQVAPPSASARRIHGWQPLHASAPCLFALGDTLPAAILYCYPWPTLWPVLQSHFIAAPLKQGAITCRLSPAAKQAASTLGLAPSAAEPQTQPCNGVALPEIRQVLCHNIILHLDRPHCTSSTCATRTWSCRLRCPFVRMLQVLCNHRQHIRHAYLRFGTALSPDENCGRQPTTPFPEAPSKQLNV